MPNHSRKFYNQHDNRSRFSNEITIRKVSFKNNPRKGNKHQNLRVDANNQRRGDGQRRGTIGEHQVREMLDQGFEEVPVQYGRGGGGSVPGPSHTLKESVSGWYAVNVLKASTYEPNYILTLVKDYVKPYEFEYFGFKKLDDETYTFIVSNFDMAEKLYLSRGRIKTLKYRPLNLFVRPVSPYVDMTNEKLQETIIKVMGKRFHAQNKSLDLSEFHKDPSFLEINMFAPIDRTNVMAFVTKAIGENLPHLVALNLSGNKIYHRDSLNPLAKLVPYLKILYIADNNLRELSMLKPLQGLDIEDIKLHGNPFLEKDKYNDVQMYISEVRSIFPKVRQIDDHVLPPPIIFDLEESTSLPKALGSFLCSAEAGPIVRVFLEQYYALFDSNNRSQLEVAYHEKAQFSLLVIDGQGNNNQLARLITRSRNFKRIEDPQRLKSLLSYGKKDIIRELRLLPETQHDFTSFTCDCPIFSPNLIRLIVSGLFKEKNDDVKKRMIRSFNRMFLLKPNPDGTFSIINDQLFITSATQEQYHYALGRVGQTVVKPTAYELSTSSSSSNNNMVSQPQLSNDTEIAIKQKMVLSLSAATKMNLEFSEKCLVETNWNYDQALTLFNQLNSTSSIPSVAFV